MTRLNEAYAAYFKAFNLSPPEPFGVSDDGLACVLEDAVAQGKPVPEDFDWHPNLPAGAVV